MQPPAYKPTLYDRHGPDALLILRAAGLSFMVFAITFGLLLLAHGFSLRVLAISLLVAGLNAAWLMGAAGFAGGTWHRLMVSGASTPAAPDFSYQTALVMQGRVEDALASYEAIIAEQPTDAAPRIQAAELYLRNERNVPRAFEILKEAQRIPEITQGQDVYVSNRLSDLLAGPLGKPGAALVELRRLIERHPDLPAAAHAREAIARIKATLLSADDSGSQA